MIPSTDDGKRLRAAIRDLFGFREPYARHPQDLVLVLTLGAPLDPDQPNPSGDRYMATGNVGQRIPLKLNVFQSDGTTPAKFDGEPVWSSDDSAIAEIRDVDGAKFVYLLAFGATNVGVTIDADRGEGVRSLTAVAQVLVSDPASEAQIVSIELGDAEDVPA